MTRCPWAIAFGIGRATRCHKEAGHIEHDHEGPGLPEFPYQRVAWLAGDRREFTTTIESNTSWEQEVGGHGF